MPNPRENKPPSPGVAILSVCLALAGCQGDLTGAGDDGGNAGNGGSGGAGGDPGEPVDVYPTRIDDVLVNPGMGFTDFHFKWMCNLPPISFTPEQCAERVVNSWPEGYPDSAVAYFRWHWRDLEPERGQINFELIDTTIQSANLLGEMLSFRVMVIAEGDVGVPQWLLESPYSVQGEWVAGGTFWPDVRDASYQAEHARFIAALGERYDGHPAVDHVDIGTVGCWGEWNVACVAGEQDIFEIYDPQSQTDREAILAGYEALIDDHLAAFPSTPVVMLGIGSEGGLEVDALVHALEGGAGWRVDCWGDWGMWGGAWSHHETLYPAMIANATAAFPGFPEVWERAPVQLEVCGVMETWAGLGWTATPPDGEVHRTFQWALEQHASVLNAKSSPVPLAYASAVDDLLRQNGYRFVVDHLQHPATIAAGGSMLVTTEWSNIGVAPSYHQRPLTYRLSGDGGETSSESAADIRTWLPGSFTVSDAINIPADLPPGTYDLEIAIIDRAGSDPVTQALEPVKLGIEGRGGDGWYLVSQIVVE